MFDGPPPNGQVFSFRRIARNFGSYLSDVCHRCIGQENRLSITTTNHEDRQPTIKNNEAEEADADRQGTTASRRQELVEDCVRQAKCAGILSFRDSEDGLRKLLSKSDAELRLFQSDSELRCSRNEEMNNDSHSLGPRPRPSVPLLQKGRTLQMLVSAVSEAEAKKNGGQIRPIEAKLTQRCVNTLVVNLWNLCAAKNTGYGKHGGMDEPVKAHILGFMGDEPPAKIHAGFSAARLGAMRENYEREIVTEIINFIAPQCDRIAKRGGRGVRVRYGVMLDAIRIKKGQRAADALDPSCIVTKSVVFHFPAADSQWWCWLFHHLPSLKTTLEAANLRITLEPPSSARTTRTHPFLLSEKAESVMTVYWS